MFYNGEKITDRVDCKAGQHIAELSLAEFNALHHAGRLVQKHGTGEAPNGTVKPAEFYTPECDECFRTRTGRHALALETQRIQRHAGEMMGRGVAEDDAYRLAVNARVTRDELRVFPEFVAHITGLEHLLDGETRATLAECCAADCKNPPSTKCDDCARDLCERHVVMYASPYGGAVKNLCRRCSPGA